MNASQIYEPMPLQSSGLFAATKSDRESIRSLCDFHKARSWLALALGQFESSNPIRPRCRFKLVDIDRVRLIAVCSRSSFAVGFWRHRLSGYCSCPLKGYLPWPPASSIDAAHRKRCRTALASCPLSRPRRLPIHPPVSPPTLFQDRVALRHHGADRPCYDMDIHDQIHALFVHVGSCPRWTEGARVQHDRLARTDESVRPGMAIRLRYARKMVDIIPTVYLHGGAMDSLPLRRR